MYLYLLFGSTYIKIGTIQRRLAWPLRKGCRAIFSVSFHKVQRKKEE